MQKFSPAWACALRFLPVARWNHPPWWSRSRRCPRPAHGCISAQLMYHNYTDTCVASACQATAHPVLSRPWNALQLLPAKTRTAWSVGPSTASRAINFPPPTGGLAWLDTPHPSVPNKSRELLTGQREARPRPLTHSILIISSASGRS